MATKKILLVDDDMDIIESMKAILASEGHIVFTAGMRRIVWMSSTKKSQMLYFWIS